MRMAKFRKRNSLANFLVSHYSEYCTKTTVHGLRHLVTSGSSKVEKFLWLTIIASATALALYLICRSYIRFENNPVVVALNKNYFKWNITFPGTTFCFQNRLDERKARELIRRKWDLTKGIQFNALMDFLLILSNSSYRNLKDFKRFVNVPKLKNINLHLTMKEINFDFEPTTYTFTKRDLQFREILTEEGICYSTSFLAPFLSTNSVKGTQEKKLEPIFCIFHELPCFGRVFNIPRPLKYYVHSQFEIPGRRDKFWMVKENLGTDTYFWFLKSEAHPSLQNLRKQQRKCRFRNELFPSSESPFYSAELCRMHCRRKMSMELCKCIPHFYTHHDDQPFCDVKGLVCLSAHSDYLITFAKDNTSVQYPCDCYPGCSEIDYFLDKTAFLTEKEFLFSGMRYSWYIERFTKIAVSRHVIFGFEELLVNLGGIAGFFIGSSIISVVELIYFFTIRLIRRFMQLPANGISNGKVQKDGGRLKKSQWLT